MLGHVLFKLPHVLINLIGTAAEPFQKARVASRIAAQSRGGDTLAATVFLDSGDKRVKCLHVLDNANWQVAGQPTIDMLPINPAACFIPAMNMTFRDALVWHLNRNKTTLVDIAKGAGISIDILNKLKAREGSSTNAETAVAIAAYFGETVEQFMRCEDVEEKQRFTAIVDLLTDEERKILLAQVRGILASRAPR